jgi:transcriptional regulator of acetoin/glycerol metabolism
MQSPTPQFTVTAPSSGSRIFHLSCSNALQHSGGERKAAAALLGISRATLYRKLSQYGLE